MLPILISLTIISVLSLIVGAAWLLISSGKSARREGSEVGEEITSELLIGDDDDPVYKKTVFKGRAKSVETEVSFSFKEIKEEVRAKRWGTAGPLLLAVGGLLGLLFFGSLLFLAATDDKLIGVFVAGIGIFAVIRVIIGMIRA